MVLRVLGWCLGAVAAALGLTVLAGPAHADNVTTDFTTTWDPAQTRAGSSAADEIRLPLEASGVYDFTVDWGDNTPTTHITNANLAAATHKYANPQEAPFTVTISGKLQGWRFNDSGDVLKISSVEKWGNVNLGNNGSYFFGAKNLKSGATDSPDMTGTTNLYRAFRGAELLEGGVAAWDTSNVTTMEDMFFLAKRFNEDISGWQTGNVEKMSTMFGFAATFNQDISGWQTGRVRTMYGMFAQASAFNQPIGSWTTDRVTSMGYMFLNAKAFDQPIGTWVTSNVTDIEYMFRAAAAFNQDLSGWDVGNVRSMLFAFEGSGLSTANYGRALVGWSQLPSLQTNVNLGAAGKRFPCAAGAARAALAASGWQISDSGEAADGCFETTWKTDNAGISNPDQITLPLESDGVYDFIVSWGDQSSDIITNASMADATHTYPAAGTYTVRISAQLKGWRFNNEGDRLKIKDVAKWGGVNLGNNGAYFFGAENLTSNATDAPDLRGTTNLSSAFAYASQLAGGLTGWDTRDVTDMSRMFLYASSFNGDISGWDTGKVTTMVGMFYHASSFNADISGWDTGNVTILAGAFQYASSFNQPIGLWNTSAVEDISDMFWAASSFNADIGGWDTGKVTSMAGTFGFATSFDADISGWNTAAVTDMTLMFADAWAFNRNISPWDTANVVTMGGMFNGAQSFDQDLGAWKIGNVTTFANAFTGSGLSSPNYDALLIGWSKSASLQQNVPLAAQGAHYSCAAAQARQSLIADHDWIIDDGGPGPQPCVTTSPLSFGAQVLGRSSLLTLTVTNTGGADLVLPTDALSITGADAGSFSLSADGCSAVTVAPQTSCDVSVSFAPASLGPKVAAVQVLSDAAGSPHAVALSGNGVAPGLSAAPDQVAFGDQLVGTTSGQRTVTVTNTGTAFLRIGSVSLTGADAGLFAVGSQTCTAAVMAPKATCTVQVVFAPGSTGAKKAGLRFTSDAAGSPHAVALSGNGVTPGLSAAPDQVAFGDQRVGTTSGQQTVTVTNTGTADLLLTAVALAGDNAAEFIVGENTCVSAAIAASGTCTVQVAFAPSSPGAKTAVLALHGNAPGSPLMVTLAGNATAPPVQPTVSPRKQTLGTPLPKWIKLSGLTVVTPKGARTNAGQPVRTLITGGPRNASAAKGRSFTIVRGPDGKTSIRTYGRPDLRFKVTQRAKPITGYTAFKRIARYIGVKRR